MNEVQKTIGNSEKIIHCLKGWRQEYGVREDQFSKKLTESQEFCSLEKGGPLGPSERQQPRVDST